MNKRNKRIPTNCAICDKPVKPNKHGLYNLTDNKDCQSKLISINSKRNKDLGKVSSDRGRSW